MSNELLRVISLGAGVQSTTMLLMALHGEFEVTPHAAVFADTGWEPRAVYAHLDWLEAEVAGRLPIYRVSAGNIQADTLRSVDDGSRFVTMPVFARGVDGRVGQLKRQCTSEYKIAPILAFERALLALKPRARPKAVLLEQWIGISLDEIARMKPSKEKWKSHRWPLVEKRMTRWDCILWLGRHGYPEPPKSACVGCPFHDNNYWRNLKAESPEEWREAVLFDHSIRRLPRIKSDNFVHRKAVPLEQVDLRTARDKGQLEFDDFTAECEGMCGV